MSKWILEGGIRINMKTNTRKVVCDACNLLDHDDNTESILPGDLIRKDDPPVMCDRCGKELERRRTQE